MGLLSRLLARLSGHTNLSPVKNGLEAEALAQALEHLPGFRVLRALDDSGDVDRLRLSEEGEQIAVVVDTETTGLDPIEDRMIEIAVQRLLFSDDGQVREVERVQTWIEDPGHPIPERIAKLTGLTDGDVIGKQFDDVAIRDLLATANVVIAHNAAFDRPFIDRRFPNLNYGAWACSLTQLDWLALGFDGRALGHLVLQSGIFFEGHRAGHDVRALTSLLATTTADGRTILSHLMDSYRRDSFRIEAVGAPFEAKDMLRSRGYRWNPSLRFWWREIDVDEAANETAWLDEQVYVGRGRPNIHRVTASERFR